MTIVIMKFGGSCLQDAEAFNKIYEITKIYENEKKIYVASAFSGITDLLLKTAYNAADTKEVDKNITLLEKRHIDVIDKIFDEAEVEFLSDFASFICSKIGQIWLKKDNGQKYLEWQCT